MQRLEDEECEIDTQLLKHWYDNQAVKGAPGWRQLLEPILASAPASRDQAWVENLCDAIPYH